jgi:hypothetical protein
LATARRAARGRDVAGGGVEERPGRCPAVDVLPPAVEEHAGLIADFAAVLDRLTGGRLPPQVSAGGVSAADVCAALAAVVTDRLVCDHGVAVTAEGVTRMAGG